MLKTVGGSIRSELKDTDSEKPLPLMDEEHVPDFFDHWMEEYISKVAADQPRTGRQTPEHTDETKADGKDARRSRSWRR